MHAWRCKFAVARLAHRTSPQRASGSHCRSWTPYRALLTERSTTLRYVNMVEIMAPIFEMELFDRMVRPTLFDAYFGWALDWVWPALLSYPPDKVAVIDVACVYHPQVDRKDSALYKLGEWAGGGTAGGLIPGTGTLVVRGRRRAGRPGVAAHSAVPFRNVGL